MTETFFHANAATMQSIQDSLANPSHSSQPSEHVLQHKANAMKSLRHQTNSAGKLDGPSFMGILFLAIIEASHMQTSKQTILTHGKRGGAAVLTK